jgi:hypothetical protein
MALESPRIRADVVEVSEFPRLAQRYQVRAVPATVFNDQMLVTGAMNEEALLEQIVKVVESGGLTSGPGQTGASTPAATATEPPGPTGLILP